MLYAYQFLVLELQVTNETLVQKNKSLQAKAGIVN